MSVQMKADYRLRSHHVPAEPQREVLFVQILGSVRVLISLKLGLLTFNRDQGRENLQPNLKSAQPLWDLSLALLKQHFDELCVNESETYGFNFP